MVFRIRLLSRICHPCSFSVIPAPSLSFLLPLCHSCSLSFLPLSVIPAPSLSSLLPFSVIPAPSLSFLLPFCHSCESRNPVLIFVACKKEKTTTLDPRLLMSRMTEGGKARMTEGGESGDDRKRKASRMTDGGKGEDDRRGIGMKIANDNPKLSFLLPLCHSCSFSVIPAPSLSFLLPFCHSCESRNPVLVVVACEKEKTTTLDPRLLMSRMTEGEKARMTEGGESGDDRKRKASRMTDGGKGEDDRRGIGMKIANDNPKLSSLLPLCHSCSFSVSCSLSVIPAPLLSFLRKQESSLGCCGM